MSEIVYPIERLSEYVSSQTVSLVKDLGDALEKVADENAGTPGLDELLSTIDRDPVPMFGLAFYAELRAMANAGFPADAVGLIEARSAALLETSLGKAGFGADLQRWNQALKAGWDALTLQDKADEWIRHIVAVFDTHYGQNTESLGTVWAKLFYLTLIADTYRADAQRVAEQLRQEMATKAESTGS